MIGARPGYIVIELAAATVLLTAAVIGVAHVAKLHTRMRHEAFESLSAELVASNQIERMRLLDEDQLRSMIDNVNRPQDARPAVMQIDMQDVSSEFVEGQHMVVHVFKVGNKLASEHYWVLRKRNADTNEEAEP